ncbi:MAG: thioredoxin family protein [Candidatus Bathyarchaeia archaeon]|jgi:thioredoxin 1
MGCALIRVDNKQDLDVQLKSKKVLAIFYSTWCPFCNRFLPAFNGQMANQKFENIVHVILDDNDNPLWDEYDVSAVPTIIYFEDGKVCDRLDARLGIGLNENLLTKWLQTFKR